MKRKLEELNKNNHEKQNNKNNNKKQNNENNETNQDNVEENIEMKTKKQKINDCCPICLNEMKDINVVTTSCNHRFCFKCLMDSCKIKNNCPLCRKEIEEYNQKKLPLFKHINMFNNILASINNPSYSIFEFIDTIRETVFEQIIDCDYNLTNEEFNIKNNILNRLENSNRLKNIIDTCLYDYTHELINKIIVDNTIRMCKWYHNNY